MILANLKDINRYEQIIPHYKELIAFLNANDLNAADKGKITILDEELFINVVEINAKNKDEQILEAHRDYLDIHIPFSQEEIIGWKATENCHQYIEQYSKENDCVLFSDRPTTYVKILPGEFAIVFPEDAHAPAIGEGILRKAIVKIRMNE